MPPKTIKNPVRPRKPKGANSGQKPKIVVTPELLQEVERLAGQGLTNEMIHYYYGVGATCWYEYIRLYPELGMAFKRGKPKAVNMVSGKLMEKVQEGNLTAIMFYLKTQARWSETINVKGDPGGVEPIPSVENVSDPVEAARIYQQIMIGS